MKALALALSCAVLVGTTACSTFLSKDKNGWGAPYSGTECAAGLTGDLLGNPFTLILVPFALIDIPLSLVADTLVLPMDLSAQKQERFVDCAFVRF